MDFVKDLFWCDDVAVMAASDWITLTVAASGFSQRVRRSSVIAYGVMPGTRTMTEAKSFVLDSSGRVLHVSETVAEIAAAVGDDSAGPVASGGPRKRGENV